MYLSKGFSKGEDKIFISHNFEWKFFPCSAVVVALTGWFLSHSDRSIYMTNAMLVDYLPEYSPVK